MKRYLLLRMRARFWVTNGWMGPHDRAFLRDRYRLVLFDRAE